VIGASKREATTRRVLLLHLAVYLLVLGLVVSLFDAGIGYEHRMLSTIQPIVLALWTWALFEFLSRLERKLAAPALLLITAVLVAFQLPGVPSFILRPRMLATKRSHEELARAVSDLPAGTLIASNATEVLYLATGRPAVSLPRIHHIHAGEPNARFSDELMELRNALRERRGVVVVPKVPDPYLPMRRVRRALGLVEVRETPSAWLYRVRRPERRSRDRGSG
jgi:hypothetical protein